MINFLELLGIEIRSLFPSGCFYRKLDWFPFDFRIPSLCRKTSSLQAENERKEPFMHFSPVGDEEKRKSFPPTVPLLA